MTKFGNAREIVQNCDRQRQQLWNEYLRIKPNLVEIARYIYPGAIPGLVRDIRNIGSESIYDDDDDANRLTGVPFDAFRIAVSGFYTNLTNPSAPWFRLNSPKFGRTDAGQDDYYADVYETLSDATRWLINWCGANRALHTIYKHLVAFGFACAVAEPDDERYVRVTCLKVGQYALGIDRKGKVDRVVRHFAFTAEQMIEEFGASQVSPSVIEAARRGDLTSRYEVWNLIEPHKKLPKVDTPYTLSYAKFRYRSVYWCAEKSVNDSCGLLAVRGYEIKPIIAPRLTFEVGDTYGRGCGANVVGHCRALQTMAEAQLDIADQEAHPSMMAPSSMADDGLRLGPLEVNYYPDGLGPNAVYRTIANPPTGERTSMEMQRLEMEIRKEMFNSEFETINAMEDNEAMAQKGGNHMTATEVQVRVNEKMEQLSGIATTLNDELLDPFVSMMAAYVRRSAIDAERLGLPPLVELPDDVKNSSAPFDIKYESAVHAAANARPINAANQSFQQAANYATATQDPSVLDNFDLDEMARDMHRKLGAPEKYLKDTEERDKIRSARAQAQAKAQQAQLDQMNARTIKDTMSAPVSPETIGGAIAGAGAEGGLA